MGIHDISVNITAHMPVWPGDPAVSLTRAASIAGGDKCNVTRIEAGVHTGTHIDAPLHFFDNGAAIESIPLEILIGPSLVIEISEERNIEKSDLQKFDLHGYERILIKTVNSRLWKQEGPFFKKFIALTDGAAQYLVEKDIRLIGIDYLSIESFYADESNPVHKLLLKNNLVILEGLDLSAISPGTYELVCLPLKIPGSDGAPARAVLRDIP